MIRPTSGAATASPGTSSLRQGVKEGLGTVVERVSTGACGMGKTLYSSEQGQRGLPRHQCAVNRRNAAALLAASPRLAETEMARERMESWPARRAYCMRDMPKENCYWG